MPRAPRKPSKSPHAIYDVLYGFVPLTDWEQEIIDSPFFQRLRWIRQLSFANYIFPGAEHTRFSHAIGVMHSMDQMVRALELAVPDSELFDSKATSEAALLHKSLRIAALLHDIGTFPFSHAVENAYIRHGNDQRSERSKKKDLPNNHEHLGSFIIKNTDYPGGLTHVLKKYGLDIQLVSDIIKGGSHYLVANQLMHSDLDADRMDYLIRDSHFTGLKYGQFDRDYILSNLVTYQAARGQLAFGIRESAVHAIEDFLIARFSWYSQVIKNPDSAKFDIMAAHVAKAFLEKAQIFQFHDLLSMIEEQDERFFWFNDMYFLGRCQEVRYHKQLRDPRVLDLTERLLYRRPPKTLDDPLFARRILSGQDEREREKLMDRVRARVEELERALEKHGQGDEWILADLPQKDVVFTAGYGKLIKGRSTDNLYSERDPVKIVSRDGEPSLLIERENTIMKHLSGFSNFVPSVYANDSAIEVLKARGLIGHKGK